jgi:hypothetical protein
MERRYNMNLNITKMSAGLIATGMILAAILLSACGKSQVTFATLETQRGIANDNSKFNAQKWRAENGFEKTSILARGDSTQQIDCPQGDGWASVDLLDPTTKAVAQKLKCSTVSANIGCLKDEDFKSRAVLATQENKCNPGLPESIKKIEN